MQIQQENRRYNDTKTKQDRKERKIIMAKNSKAKYFWIPLAGLILTAAIVLIPYVYGTGKAQATLVATDKALAKADTEIIKDVKENKDDIEKLETKFDAYHTAQTLANTEILSRLPE
ncbi:hypothetical protein LCGC14_1058330 [marine sediment metagenome]|uniref:Uncharacterized protein n=1 Tax=marine sediment metagenome TaxID=412755 RepID=A0A0F9QST9_9ZZZZ